VVTPDNRKHLGEQWPNCYLSKRFSIVLRQKVFEVTLHVCSIDCSACKTKLEHCIHEPLGILARESQEYLYQLFLSAIIHDSNHAIIDQSDGAARLNEEIPRMRISVIKAIFKYHLKNKASSAICKLWSVYASGIECGKVVHFNALNEGKK